MNQAIKNDLEELERLNDLINEVRQRLLPFVEKAFDRKRDIDNKHKTEYFYHRHGGQLVDWDVYGKNIEVEWKENFSYGESGTDSFNIEFLDPKKLNEYEALKKAEAEAYRKQKIANELNAKKQTIERLTQELEKIEDCS